MTNIVVINGTNSVKSRVNGVAKYLQNNYNATVLNVYELPAEDLMVANFASTDIKAANELVAQAEVVVLLTPIYKASYSGILKTYLDLIPQKGFEQKTILPIAVGGTDRHLLAIDYALKPVAAVLGATNILQGVFILDQHIQYDAAQKFTINNEVLNRLNEQLKIIETVNS